ncbi:uncharacterized protein C2orf50-like isoform X2 [Haliotis rufescens]|uniref:uncharacterized protein C2orf50-like isoform X2 n=2 Tax=Haliotis TaxID=6452 RepID=UPI001EB0997E|nr:uncharacterized protein C2orf50-like isoform X2 [Haliotis rufescens]
MRVRSCCWRNRTTSWINMVERAYHDSCIPKDKQLAAPAASSRNYSEGDFRKCDKVTQDTIWKEGVSSEKRCLKNWEDNWGFLTEFDAKGQPKEKEETPENLTIFSDEIPNTNSGNYGNRIASDVGHAMQKMEHKFYSDNRRKRKEELICY